MARKFNGIGDHAASAAALDLSSASTGTVAGWFRIDAYSNSDQVQLEHGSSYFAQFGGWALDLDSSSGPASSMAIFVHGPSGDASTFWPRPSAAAWHHLLYTINLASTPPAALWVDGVAVTPSSATGPAPGGNLANVVLNIMCRNGNTLLTAGRLEQLAIWRGTLLGSSDRAAVFAGTPASASVTPTYYWPLIGQASPEVATNGGVNLTVTGTAAYPGHTAVTYAVNDPNLFFSENWWVNGSTYAQSIHMGAYIKGRKSFNCAVLGVSVAPQMAAGLNPSEYPAIKWTPAVGGADWQAQQLASGQTELNLTPVALAAAARDLLVVFNSLVTDSDRYSAAGGPSTAFRVTSLTLDGGGSLLPPTLLDGRARIKGDSITESAIDAGPVLSAMDSWAWHCARGLSCEHGQAGISGRGWTLNAVPTTNVPPFFTPGNDALSSWNKLDGLGHSWPVADPDYVITCLGPNDNDFGTGGTPAAVTASVAGYLAAERALHPISKIAILIPFSHVLLGEITAGYDAYQAATPDPIARLITLPASFAAGMLRTDPVNNRSALPPHPNSRHSADLGAAAAGLVVAAFAPAGGGTRTRQLQRVR